MQPQRMPEDSTASPKRAPAPWRIAGAGWEHRDGSHREQSLGASSSAQQHRVGTWNRALRVQQPLQLFFT